MFLSASPGSPVVCEEATSVIDLDQSKVAGRGGGEARILACILACISVKP